jgi:hypothetical protein
MPVLLGNFCISDSLRISQARQTGGLRSVETSNNHATAPDDRRKPDEPRYVS